LVSLWLKGHSLTAQPPKIEDPATDTLMVANSNSLIGRIGFNDPNETYYLFSNTDPKLKPICSCESSLRPEVCSYAGCVSGLGLCGFIPSTWNSTLLRMKEAKVLIPEKCDVPIGSVKGFETDKSHPVFDAGCNVLLADWLLKTDGDSHWNSSKSCWAPKVGT
jgi:hypothetical protein